MIVNDLGFDYLTFGEETISCITHHLEHLDNQDIPWPAEPLPTKIHLGYCFVRWLNKFIQMVNLIGVLNDREWSWIWLSYFWRGDNTLHGTSLRTPGHPRNALACGTLAKKKSSWILFRLMIEQIHSNGKPYWCTEWSWMILDLIILFLERRQYLAWHIT